MNRLFHSAGVLVDVDRAEVVGGREEVAAVRSARRVNVREVREGPPDALHLPAETARESRVVVGDRFRTRGWDLLACRHIHPHQLVSLGVKDYCT